MASKKKKPLSSLVQAITLQAFFTHFQPYHSLWRDLPSDQTQPQAKSDTQRERLFFGGKTVVAASRRGRAHAHEGKYREDDFLLHQDESSGWLLLCVADGAGSAANAVRASRLACEAVRDFCLKMGFSALQSAAEAYFMDSKQGQPLRLALYNLLGGAAFSAAKSLKNAAESAGEPFRSFATTLSFVLLRRCDMGWTLASFGVGDSPAALLRADNNAVELLHAPDEGEYAGQTYFLTSPQWARDAKSIFARLKFIQVNDFQLLALMSDGIYDPIFEHSSALLQPKKWEHLHAELIQNGCHDEEGERLLQWLNFWSQGNHDDRTLIAVF